MHDIQHANMLAGGPGARQGPSPLRWVSVGAGDTHRVTIQSTHRTAKRQYYKATLNGEEIVAKSSDPVLRRLPRHEGQGALRPRRVLPAGCPLSRAHRSRPRQGGGAPCRRY